MKADKKIKILYVIESIARGGAENSLLSMLKYLNRDMFEAKVLYLYDKNDLEKDFNMIGISTQCLGMRNVYDLSKGIKGITGDIKKNKYDIIHTQLFGANIYGRIAAILTGRPVVTTLQNPDYSFERSFHRKILDKLTLLLSRTNFTAISKIVKQSYMKELGLKERQIEIIYNFLDIEKIAADRKGTPPGLPKKYILNIGRLHPQKGHKYLFSAFKRVVEKKRDIDLVLIGDGPLRGQLVKLAKELGISQKVHFLGKVDNVFPYLERACMFVFPSVYEGLGVALLEAMALGVPCIASDIPCIKEIEDGTGAIILIDPGDIDSLEGSVLRVLDDIKTRQKMIEKGTEIINQRFDASKNVVKFERYFKKIIGCK